MIKVGDILKNGNPFQSCKRWEVVEIINGMIKMKELFVTTTHHSYTTVDDHIMVDVILTRKFKIDQINTTDDRFKINGQLLLLDFTKIIPLGNFTGSLNIGNIFGSYYNDYTLAISGTINFSIGSSTLFGKCYLKIISDGITPFTTDANFTSIFKNLGNILNIGPNTFTPLNF